MTPHGQNFSRTEYCSGVLSVKGYVGTPISCVTEFISVSLFLV